MSGADRLCTYVNKPWLVFTGRTLNSELGTGWIEGVYAEDRPRRLAAFTEAVERRVPYRTEYRLRRHDGEYRWMLDSGVPRFNQDGSLAGYIAWCVDVTDLKRSVTNDAYASERLHMAMEAGKSVGWDWDLKSNRDTRFGDLLTMFGIPAKGYDGDIEDFRRAVHPEDRSLVWRAIEKAKHSRTAYAAEFRILWPDGTVRWVASKGKFYYAPDGEPERMLGMAVDITERKHVEESLRRKGMELTESQRLAGIGTWGWDPASDTVTWSEELYRLAGREPSLPALSYKEHSQLYTPESWEQLRRAVEEALRTGTPYELDLERVCADGTTKWLTARGEAQQDASGRIARLHGTVQDITERRLAQQTLREGEERFRLAAGAGKMFAYTWDAATDTIVRSGEFAHILGIDPATPVTSKQILDMIHPDDRARVMAAVAALTPENPRLQVTYRMLRPDGTMIWVERTSCAYFDGNRSTQRIVGMVADITPRKLAEEALSSVSRRLIEAQETERARIARDLHDDFGQRLALLLVTFGQMKELTSDSGRDVRRCVDVLQRQTAEIAAGVHTLSHELHPFRLQLLGVVGAMKEFCTELSELQKVEIDFSDRDIPRTVTPRVSLCLFRVLQEALHNAVRYSGVRHFAVHLRGTSEAVFLTVRDTGIGFVPEAATGRGLGLVSMKERLKLAGGELSIESELKRGTTIVAWVPLRDETS
jgi:PAS domain S-box-containing protein